MNQAQISVFHGAGQPIEMLQIEIPELKRDEILVRNLYTTICGSDLHTFCGLRSEKVPTVLGHEIVGEIVAFSETHGKFDHLGNPLKIGDRVTWSIFASDASSLMSMFGMPQKASGLFKYGHTQITDGDALHGGLATHCVIKNGTAIIKLSEKIPLKVAATINCSIATVAGALRLAGNVNNKRVFITGSGLLGIVCAAMCRSNGAASVLMGDINPERLKKSLDFGVDATYLLTDQHELPAAIDIAFDMSGSTDAMEQGLASLGVGNTAVWIGAVFKSRPVQIDAEQIVRRIISIKGLHNYNYEDFVAAVDFITAHHETYPFDSIVSKEFDLENSEVAMKYAVEKKPFRVGINMEKNESDGK
ncbi:alcohol dehydrogenase catalytic domain-containing protein [Pedobacter sp. MC2016-05]|uniref:alcohol dehydrogenase catalytic domain-containing protein n=1 Tax=Pedobacter sp. MC2016-05 TaxID=2994474 RepID=UPI002248009A|nr:alcohol dehydrogenase catalytic domain-containing protein [Pedobacter sp. MC2016-05]MCX2476986.1 alcohol dehydrogenase catalytic domain-containing protein [Pedobacter sp. MC2016-05]